MNLKNLVAKYKAALAEAIREAANDAAIQASDFWDDFDKAIEEEIKNQECSLSFHDKTRALIGIGTGDCCVKVEPEISIDTYDGLDLSESHRSLQLEDVQKQIEGITQFIAKLEAAREDLRAALPSP